MSPASPSGDPAPSDGRLPDSAVSGWGTRPFGVYIHVPFCASRCGYCDFNTYTADQLGGGANREQFAGRLNSEIRWSRTVLGAADVPVATVFFGGGTPTLLPAGHLEFLLAQVADTFGLAPDAEITVEANPDSVDPPLLNRLREAGFNRISFGMQSANERVLATLDRTHTPGRAVSAVAQARSAGFDNISLDLIYGTPGESLADWEQTLDAAISSPVSHISAYSLIVETGTAMARAISAGRLEPSDDDLMARMYELADYRLSSAGLHWYELSNWALPGRACQHNIGYWHSHDWWGYGPGAHSHVQGVRWWNVSHPRAYVTRVDVGVSPAQGREVLAPATKLVEEIMLRTRLVEGLSSDLIGPRCIDAAQAAVADGLASWQGDRLVLTGTGRLMADAVVRSLVLDLD